VLYISWIGTVHYWFTLWDDVAQKYKLPLGNNCLWKCLFLNWNCSDQQHTPKYSCLSKIKLPVAFY